MKFKKDVGSAISIPKGGLGSAGMFIFRKIKKATLGWPVCLAEEEGFEPPVPFGTPVFKTGALNQLCHSSRAFYQSDRKDKDSI